jgi:hypothetical protein
MTGRRGHWFFGRPARQASPSALWQRIGEHGGKDTRGLCTEGPLQAATAGHMRSKGDRDGRVEMWRGGGRRSISVSAPFVWRCLTSRAIAPFPHPAHRTGHADLPHPALGQDVTLSPTPGRAQGGQDVRARSARRGVREDSSRRGVAGPCTWSATTGVTAQRCRCRAHDTHG